MTAHDGHPHHGHTHHGHTRDGDLDLAALLDLDAQVLPFTPEIAGRVAGVLPAPPSWVVDLGAGSGTGSLEWAARYPDAQVLAVDQSPVMVHRLQEVFEDAGLGSRTRVQQAEVDRTWTPPEPVDLVWASAMLHEVADAAGLMTAVRSALRPGGHFAVVEMDSPPRFLPDDLGIGEPGFEDRLHTAVAASGGQAPHPQWAGALREAGFVDVTEERVDLEVDSPTDLVRRFAAVYLGRVAPAVDGRMSATDLRTLRELLAADGPRSLATRSDLVVRATRTLWIARTP